MLTDIILLIFSLMTALVLLTGLKEPANRWGSLALLLVCLGGFFSSLDDSHISLVRYISDTHLSRVLSDCWIVIFFKTPLLIFPFALLIFITHYLNLFNNFGSTIRILLLIALLIPIGIMYAIPFQLLDFISLRRYLIFTDLWAIPYMLIALYLLYQFTVCVNQYKIERLLTGLTIGVLSFIYIVAVYILPLYHYTIFKYNLYLVACFMGLHFIFIFRYGFFGIKVSIGSVYLDNAIKTVSSEAVILNQHLKDQIVSISNCAENIIAASNRERALIVQNTKAILSSADDITNMVERLHHYLHYVNLNPAPQDLIVLVNEAINLIQTTYSGKTILIDNQLPREVIIQGDRFYLVDIIGCILQNSLESMTNGGIIRISVLSRKHNIILKICDTGCGIPLKDLPHVVEPFYTTKDPDQHFGLGLSYSYQILQQHGGKLEIESIENQGTTVFLNFRIKTHIFSFS